MLNSCDFVGNLVSDPIFYDGTPPRAVFRLAVDHDGKAKDGQKNTEFLDFVAWRNTAEYLSRYCHKGDLLSVHSMAKSHEYTKADGTKESKTEFSVESVNVCSRAKDFSYSPKK